MVKLTLKRIDQSVTLIVELYLPNILQVLHDMLLLMLICST